VSPRNATAYQGARTYERDGVKVPSVTTYLQAFPKPWLGPWAAKMVAEAVIFGDGEWRDLPADEGLRHLKGTPWRKRDVAADFGSAVHEALAQLVANQPVTVLDGAEGHVKALREWWDAYRPHVLDSEIQVWGDGYAGSLDLIADVYGRRLLIDLKTSNVRPGADVRLQLAAYRYAEDIFEDDRRIGGVPEVDACAALWIPRDNPAEWQFIELPAGATEYALFRHLMAVWHYHKDTDKDAGGSLILPQLRVEIA
jgi:hypothetical protein